MTGPDLTALEKAVLERLDDTWQMVVEIHGQVHHTKGEIVAALRGLKRKGYATYRAPSRVTGVLKVGEWASTAKGDTYNWERHA